VTFSRLPHESDGWETISNKVHFEDAHLAVATEIVLMPARPRPQRWTVVHRKPAVVVAPLTADGKLVLIRQERIPIRTALWEVPAGQIDDAEANPSEIEAVALRELREETGYELEAASNLVPLGHFFSSPGFTDEHAYLFLARAIRAAADGPAHQESEAILDCRAFRPSEVARMITNNEICDANTLSICAKLTALGLFVLESE
jgi:ADP-ribose pyrophosphatase